MLNAFFFLEVRSLCLLCRVKGEYRRFMYLRKSVRKKLCGGNGGNGGFWFKWWVSVWNGNGEGKTLGWF